MKRLHGNRPRLGMTLIEILVSVSLGMILLAMGASALMQISRVAKRDTAQRQAHGEMGALSRNLRLSLGAMHHGSLVRVEASGGEDGVWGSGDEVITVYWMAHLRDRTSRFQGFDVPYDRELVWYMLRWSGDPDTPETDDGVLHWALSSNGWSSARQSVPDETGNSRDRQIQVAPQWRRDRRRDLSDNDGRYIDGMTPELWELLDVPSDADDLNEQALPVHAPATVIRNFIVEWVDAGGHTVRCDANSGVSVDGVALSADPTRPWHNQNGYSADGLYGDGQVVVPVDSSRTNVAQRPNLMRFSMVMVPKTNSGVLLEDEPHLPFSMTFNTTTTLPFIP